MNTFDYAGLDPETRIVVQQRTGEIKSLVRRSVADVIEIGAKLAEVKARLQHGQFGDWLEGEFGWSHDTAGRFLNVAAQFGQIPQIADFAAASALYLLAAPSTPEPARQEAVQMAAAGERVTVAKAKIIIDQHRPARLSSEPASLRPPAPDPGNTADLLPVLQDWLTVFKTDRQRDMALQDVARNGSAYQPALRVRLPLDAKTSDVRVAARALRGQPTPDVALAAVNGAGGERPTPAIVRPAPSQSATARDLSLDELRAALLELLTLPHSATNADILAAVGTLQAVYEVSRE